MFLYLTPPPPGFPAPRPAAPGFPQLGAAAGSTARPYEVALECGGFKFYSGEAACTTSSSEVADLRRLLEENGGALGHRYTTDSLKQIKTKIVNLTQHMLKRTDININSPAMRFCKSEMEAKRNKTAEEPMKENAGARKRVALEEEDRVKMDRWMTKPVDKVRIHLIIHSPYYPLTMLAIHHVL